MITILIVDDERLERNGIKFLLQQEQGEFEVLEACNGKDALGVLQSGRVDILLSDIKMPYMNGLELAAQARTLYPGLPIVIFSGYNDFSFAREALRYGVSDYVLKPVDPEEFHKTLEKVIHNISFLREQEEKQTRKEDYLKKYFLLQYLFTGREENIRSARELVGLNEGGLNEYRRLVLAGSQGDFFELEEEACMEELKEKIQRNFFYLNRNSNESLFFFRERTGDYERLALQLYHFFKQKYDVECYFAVSPQVEGYQDMPGLLTGLEQLLEEQFYQPGIHVFSMEKKEQEGTADVQDAQALQNIMEDIRHKDVVHLKQNFRIMEQKYRKQTQFSEMYVKFVFSSIVKEINAVFGDSGERELSREVDRLYRCRTIQEVLDITGKAVRELEEFVNEENGGFRDEITRVKSYIYHHYDEELGTEMLAQQVCLSPGYLSYIFKKETGVNLNRFIRDCRMNKARQLLETTNRKVTDIAGSVGFSNNSYFCKSFREYFGDTPESFRKGTTDDKESDS